MAATDTVLILHTNDLHDHIRSNYDGIGGLPYVSGYIKSVRAERPDTLVLDGGDVMEKGDMLPFLTKSTAMYEAIAQIGYDAGAVGNHDSTYGIDHLHACEKLAGGMKLLCLNMLGSDKEPCFTPSALFDVDGVKVGVIGLTVQRGTNVLPVAASGKALATEAERLDREAHLIVAVCHLGSKDCAVLSALAPNVDVFISGHTHEVIRETKAVKDTGAVIVQAGNYGSYVGRLELTIDLDSEAIVQRDGRLVSLEHDTAPCDTELAAWILERERMVCADAPRVVACSNRSLSHAECARLVAAALRERGGAEIGLCHAKTIVREVLVEGEVDVNALFRTGGQKGYDLVSVGLTGSEIEQYFVHSMTENKGWSQWVGFRARMEGSGASRTMATNLEPDRVYSVVLTAREWTDHMAPMLDKAAKTAGNPPPTARRRPCDFTFIDALKAYAEKLTAAGIALDADEDRLAKESELPAG